jgi:Ni/Fe-hydrogenase subunit HybB-like protein
MERARSHRRLAGVGAFALLALVAEIVGRSLTVSLDLGRHVPTPSYSGANYYPFLLVFVKAGVALMLTALTWRFVRARAAARAARRVLGAVGGRAHRAPRVRIELTLRSWALAYALTAGIYLVQTDTERFAAGEWPLVSPWLHTSALSVFAVLSVVVALVYGAVSRWLTDYELYAEQVAAAARSLLRLLKLAVTPRARSSFDPPRRLFGLAFESRPPPARA